MQETTTEDKKRRILDIESYKPMFCITFEDFYTGKYVYFEISRRRNDLKALKHYYFNEIVIGMTFNGIDYDDIMLAYVVSLNENEDGHSLAVKIRECSDAIINKEKNFQAFSKKYGKFRYNHPYEKLDIYRYWSKLLRKNKQIGLKSLGSQLGLDIVESPVSFDADYLTDEEMNNIAKYNKSDTGITGEVIREKIKDVRLRIYAEEKYGFECLSWDGVKLGYNVILTKLSEKSGIPFEDLDKRRTKREQIVLNDIILPHISFKEDDGKMWIQKIKKVYYHCFKTFGALLRHLKTLTVKSTEEINCRVYYKGTVYDIKSGGVHSVHENDLVIPQEDEDYVDKDVASYYPRMISAWGFVPEHFKGIGFEEVVEESRLERVAVKKSNPPEAELLKLGLNGGIFGNMNNAYTGMEDLQAFLSVTINGQLGLLMLAERAELLGIHVDMANTDGLTFLFKKHLREQFETLCSKWEKLMRMDLEAVEYEKVVRKNINNYMAFYHEYDKDKGKNVLKIKKKGKYFKSKLELADSSDFFVIPKAVEAYFKSGILPEDFIPKHENIYDFCASQKINKQYDVIFKDKKIQQINRYFISKKGAYLYKQKKSKKQKVNRASLNPNQMSLFGLQEPLVKESKGNLEAVLLGTPIVILNEKTDKKAQEFPIDFNEYIVRAREKIRVFESNQTSI